MSKIIPPSSLKATLAKKILPIDNCCSKGCKKCPYGRWLKRRGQSWHVLIDESLKLISPYVWIALSLATFALGHYVNG